MNKKRILKWILLIVLILLIPGVLFGGYEIYMVSSTPKEYLITTPNRKDTQGNMQCSGYASAYALRDLGDEWDGSDLYEQLIPHQPDGAVYPEDVTESLNRLGYHAKMHTGGTILGLKHEISKGHVVIAFIRIGVGSDELHYVPMVGYSEHRMYMVDSMMVYRNSTHKNYNRYVSVDEFKQMWNTHHPKKNIYITISK